MKTDSTTDWESAQASYPEGKMSYLCLGDPCWNSRGRSNCGPERLMNESFAVLSDKQLEETTLMGDGFGSTKPDPHREWAAFKRSLKMDRRSSEVSTIILSDAEPSGNTSTAAPATSDDRATPDVRTDRRPKRVGQGHRTKGASDQNARQRRMHCRGRRKQEGRRGKQRVRKTLKK